MNLCSKVDDPLQIYREHFEQSYLTWTSNHYQVEADAYLSEHGVREYMSYVSSIDGESFRWS